MLLSGGNLVLSDTTPTFARTNYYPNTGLDLTSMHATYGAIYRAQLWVFVVVSKRARAVARLPLKVYRRSDKGREIMRDTPYAKILARPNPKHDANFFWRWVQSTKDIYGEAILVKIRGSNGKPSELWPMHPSLTQIQHLPNEATGEVETWYCYLGGQAATSPLLMIPERDIVHFKDYNPDTTVRGFSALEPLRQTLVNEDAARRATSSFWANGARPGVALSHPKTLSKSAADRLKAQWNDAAGGVDRTGVTVVLEEGMEPKILTLSAEEAQYIETRKLNREEVCAAYDVPPPVVHILDRATFSNITEQMRSMYRDTMAPPIGSLEATLDFALRPEFEGPEVYAEFLMDEVLRGSFEESADKIQSAVNSGQLTPNEGRALSNRPALPGGDRLFINSTMIPIEATSSRTSPVAPADDEHLGDGKPPPVAPKADPKPVAANADASAPKPKGVDAGHLPMLMGRLSRPRSIEDVDGGQLTAGLNGDTQAVLEALAASKSVDDLRARIKALCAPGGA